MTYAAELTFELDFRGDDALARHLGRAGWESQGDDPAACGWAIVASFSEFASGALDGLHLTGVGGGRLLDGFAQRLRLLAIDAAGVVAGADEDGTRWCHRLERGRIITLHGAGNSLGGSLIEPPYVITPQSIGCRWPSSREVGSEAFGSSKRVERPQARWPPTDEADAHSPVTNHRR